MKIKILKKWIWSDDWQWGILPLAIEEDNGRVSWLSRYIICAAAIMAGWSIWLMPWVTPFVSLGWQIAALGAVIAVGAIRGALMAADGEMRGYPHYRERKEFRNAVRWVRYMIIPSGRAAEVRWRKDRGATVIATMLAAALLGYLGLAVAARMARIDFGERTYAVYLSPEMREEKLDGEYGGLLYRREREKLEETESARERRRVITWAAEHQIEWVPYASGVSFLLAVVLARLISRRRRNALLAPWQREQARLHQRLADAERGRAEAWQRLNNHRDAVGTDLAYLHVLLTAIPKQRGHKNIGEAKKVINAWLDQLFPLPSDDESRRKENQATRDRFFGAAARRLHGSPTAEDPSENPPAAAPADPTPSDKPN